MCTIKLHSTETLGALDGPGIRTVFFFQGCVMRCRYCHNADALSFDGGQEKTADELLAFSLRYRNYYGSGGGVTLSGGEPLCQKDGAVSLLKKLKAAKIHTALDTSGCVFVPEALEIADLVILDVKHTDPEKFLWLTGVKIDNTLKTLEYLKSNNKKFMIRQVILGGFNDTEQQVLALKEMSAGAEKVELLPYHTMGTDKWAKAGLEFTLKDAAPTDKATMDRLEHILK